jgi:hypothetical protein
MISGTMYVRRREQFFSRPHELSLGQPGNPEVVDSAGGGKEGRMRYILVVLAVLTMVYRPAVARTQEEGPSWADSQEQEKLQRAQRELLELRAEDKSPDLWYRTPGVRPGGDLLEPVMDLLRKPSGLLDFKPRKVQSWLPDRETAEFLRDRR